LEKVNQNTMLEMEGGVQGARLGNWSITRKQQARAQRDWSESRCQKRNPKLLERGSQKGYQDGLFAHCNTRKN